MTDLQILACRAVFARMPMDVFGPHYGIDPKIFYEEFELRHGHDWESFLTACAGVNLSDMASDIGKSLVGQIAVEFGMNGRDFEDDANLFIGNRLVPFLADGRGVVMLLEAHRRWTMVVDGVSVDQRAKFKALSSSGLLPASMRGKSARDLLASVGIGIVDLLEKLGMSGEIDDFSNFTPDEIVDVISSGLPYTQFEMETRHRRAREALVAVVGLLAWRREMYGMRIDVDAIQTALNLRNMVAVVTGNLEPEFPEELRNRMASYLSSIPGYRPEAGKRQSQTTLDQHGDVQLLVARSLFQREKVTDVVLDGVS
jgi:hypothetical protein